MCGTLVLGLPNWGWAQGSVYESSCRPEIGFDSSQTWETYPGDELGLHRGRIGGQSRKVALGTPRREDSRGRAVERTDRSGHRPEAGRGQREVQGGRFQGSLSGSKRLVREMGQDGESEGSRSDGTSYSAAGGSKHPRLEE